jgi:GH24 family phage-related lysozyme (muramidase)
VGAAAFASSTMLRLINQGAMDRAAAQFDRWHLPPEITARRNGEKAQFEGTRFEARIEGAVI